MFFSTLSNNARRVAVEFWLRVAGILACMVAPHIVATNPFFGRFCLGDERVQCMDDMANSWSFIFMDRHYGQELHRLTYLYIYIHIHAHTDIWDM